MDLVKTKVETEYCENQFKEFLLMTGENFKFCKIYSANGELVGKIDAEEIDRIITKDELKKGVYFLRLFNSGNSTSVFRLNVR